MTSNALTRFRKCAAPLAVVALMAAVTGPSVAQSLDVVDRAFEERYRNETPSGRAFSSAKLDVRAIARNRVLGKGIAEHCRALAQHLQQLEKELALDIAEVQATDQYVFVEKDNEIIQVDSWVKSWLASLSDQSQRMRRQNAEDCRPHDDYFDVSVSMPNGFGAYE